MLISFVKIIRQIEYAMLPVACDTKHPESRANLAFPREFVGRSD